MKRFLFDYESQSQVDLKKLGAVEYAKHHSTKALCLGIKKNNEKSKLWLPGDSLPYEFEEALEDKEFVFTAHNAFFEYCMTKFVLTRYFKGKRKRQLEELSIERYKCTAAKAATCALPRSLEGAGAAIKLPIQKNMDGRRLMLKYMKPTQKWSKWFNTKSNKPEPQMYHDDELELYSIYAYCLTDVEAEAMLDDALPDLSRYEQNVWVANQKMNFRGIQIDIPTVKKVLKLSKQHVDELQESVSKITHGELDSVLKVKATLEWFDSKGFEYTNLRADTVKAALEDGELPDGVRQILKIRQAVSKTSNKKYNAMLTRAGTDGRVRDLTMYHGASTGREAGRGLQVQNLPRGSIKNVELAIKIIQMCEDIEDLKLFYDDPANVFSSCIRSMVKATDNYELFVADFNAIECRVLQWLAGNKEAIDDFNKGVDRYKKLATLIFNIDIDDVNEDQRFVGKQGELGSGYGLGWKKFILMCAQYGRHITDEIAKKTIDAYRESNKDVVKMWSNVENAAIKAVQNKGKSYTVNRTTWYFLKGFLWCVLPSGRRLAFYGATVKTEKTPWGELRPKLYYWRVNPKNKKWESIGTYGGSLVESVCQATARDLTVNGIKNMEKNNFKYLFQCHDEIICEKIKGVSSLEEYIELMVAKPLWAESLPIKSSGWVGERYKK